MSSPAPNSFLSVVDANCIVDTGKGFIDAIIKLAALGLKSDGILEYARAISHGEKPSATLGVGQMKDTVVQAHSFLQDVRQYNQLYGVSEERVIELRALYSSDRPACFAEITSIVTVAHQLRGSQRGVRVIDAGAPGSAPSGASSTAGSAGLVRAFKQEIASNSGVYGAYQFEATPTNRGATQAFCVDLGYNLFVLAQSKKLAVAVARVVRVRGRSDPMVRDYVYYVASNNRICSGSDIPDACPSLAFGPRDTIKPSSRRVGVSDIVAQTEALDIKEPTSRNSPPPPPASSVGGERKAGNGK